MSYRSVEFVLGTTTGTMVSIDQFGHCEITDARTGCVVRVPWQEMQSLASLIETLEEKNLEKGNDPSEVADPDDLFAAFEDNEDEAVE